MNLKNLQARLAREGIQVAMAAPNKLTPKHHKQLDEASKARGASPKEILKLWNTIRPHFDNSMPHRYDGRDKECAYCLCPIDWKRSAKGSVVMAAASFENDKQKMLKLLMQVYKTASSLERNHLAMRRIQMDTHDLMESIKRTKQGGW